MHPQARGPPPPPAAVAQTQQQFSLLDIATPPLSPPMSQQGTPGSPATLHRGDQQYQQQQQLQPYPLQRQGAAKPLLDLMGNSPPHPAQIPAAGEC